MQVSLAARARRTLGWLERGVGRQALQLLDDPRERVGKQHADAQRGLHVLHVDAAQHVHVLGAEAERATDFLDRRHVVAPLVVEVPDVFAVGLVSNPAQGAHAIHEALAKPAGYGA